MLVMHAARIDRFGGQREFGEEWSARKPGSGQIEPAIVSAVSPGEKPNSSNSDA